MTWTFLWWAHNVLLESLYVQLPPSALRYSTLSKLAALNFQHSFLSCLQGSADLSRIYTSSYTKDNFKGPWESPNPEFISKRQNMDTKFKRYRTPNISRLKFCQNKHELGTWDSGQHCFVKGDVGVSLVVNNESHQGDADGTNNPCNHCNSHHAAVHISLWSVCEGERHFSVLGGRPRNAATDSTQARLWPLTPKVTNQIYHNSQGAFGVIYFLATLTSLWRSELV